MSKKYWYSLVAVVVAAATALSACGPSAPAPTGGGKVEVFSWWVGPGEADGLAAMIKIFQGQFPKDEFVNASVAGALLMYEVMRKRRNLT